MTNPPSGTVTFLFTDIEGSTQLARQHPDTMPAALARHHAILNEAIGDNEGYLFRTLGDEFEVAFATAQQALAAVLTAQRELQQADWSATGPLRVRMGLHTGPAVPRGDDYEGYLTLAHTKRLMAVAVGEQVLVSQAAHALLYEHLTPGITLQDLGAHRLKDFDRAENIYQVRAPDLRSDFPPLASLDTHPNNLPTQLTSFVGREKELEELEELLKTTRLLTLAGPGGTGKTRLALQLAMRVLEDYKEGVWFVELAPLADPTLVVNKVATTLGVREQPGRTPFDALMDHLRAKNLLLILDNCEHVINASASLVESLLQGAPHLKILVTSRESFGISGEHIFRVPTLSVPDMRRVQDLTALAQTDCVKLFVDRATAAYPKFALSEQNAAAIAQICSRLDGIPLAVELAAARVKVLPPAQIAARLDDRFRLLTGGSRTALERHQTLSALIEWSYNLLTEPERVLLRRLSVFAGGWRLEAAQAVCGDGLGADALDTLARLADKSLVVVEERGEATEGRYRLLETIRQYARDKLLESGESPQTRDGHLDFFVRLTEEAEPKLRSAAQLDWLDRLETEHDNLRAALGWALESGKREQALRLAGAAFYFWFLHLNSVEGTRWLDRALIEDSLAPRVENMITSPEAAARRAKALYGSGMLHFLEGLSQVVISNLDESLRLWRALGNKWWTALALKDRGQLDFTAGDGAAARARCEEAVALARETGSKWLLATCLTKLALTVGAGERDTVLALLEEAVICARESGDRAILSYALSNLSTIYFHLGEAGKIPALAAESLVAAREIKSLIDVTFALGAQSLGAFAQRKTGVAAESVLEIQSLANETGSLLVSFLSLFAVSFLGVATDQAQRGAELAGAVDKYGRSLGFDFANWGGGALAGSGALFRYVLEAAQKQLGAASFAAALEKGRTLTTEQVNALADEIISVVQAQAVTGMGDQPT